LAVTAGNREDRRKDIPMIRREQITRLAEKFRTRDQEVGQATANLAKFLGFLYAAVEEVSDALHKEGITTVHVPEREKLADGREQLSFVERDYRFVFVPYPGVAFPALSGCGLPDELVSELSQRRAGRLVAFHHPVENPDAVKALCSFYVFATGFWCVCGAGYSEHRPLDGQEIADYAVRFLDLIQDGFKKHWRAQLDTTPSAGDSIGPETRFSILRVVSEE
jgi:hypothetical protein